MFRLQLRRQHEQARVSIDRQQLIFIARNDLQ
jgi:hypothetical protein